MLKILCNKGNAKKAMRERERERVHEYYCLMRVIACPFITAIRLLS